MPQLLCWEEESPWTISPVFTAEENAHRYSQNQVEDNIDYSEGQFWLLWPKFCLQHEYVFHMSFTSTGKNIRQNSQKSWNRSKAAAAGHEQNLCTRTSARSGTPEADNGKSKDKIHAKDPALHCSLSMQVAHLNKGRIWSGRKQKLNDGTVASLHFGPPLSAQTQASEGDIATSAPLEQPHWWQKCMDWKANTGASWSAKVLQTKPCKMQG